ncbi:MAG: hypothetical protein V1797_17190 [Pseudomonadota bacterium]
MQGEIHTQTLAVQTAALLKSYEQEDADPRHQPEPWRDEVEKRLKRNGVSLAWLRNIACTIPGAHRHGEMFLELCSTNLPRQEEPDWKLMRARDFYKNLAECLISGEAISRQAHTFKMACCDHVERVIEGCGDWCELQDLVYKDALPRCLKSLCETDREGDCFQVVLNWPGAFVNAVLHRVRAELEHSGREALPPFGPGDIDPEASAVHQAPKPPAPWFWPLDLQAQAVYLHYIGAAATPCLKAPNCLAMTEAALRVAGVDLEIMERLARAFGNACIEDGQALLDVCRRSLTVIDARPAAVA